MQRVCVYCGSSLGGDPRIAAAARELGARIAARSLGLVYGGAGIGLMGLVADAALEGGAEVIGVIPQALASKEVAHTGLTDLRIVDSMHERKGLMADMADAFIALPGGMGTFEELCETLTWGQLGIHAKPVGMLNVGGYFDPLIEMFDRACEAGFLPRRHREMALIESDPDALLDRLRDYRPPPITSWADRASR